MLEMASNLLRQGELDLVVLPKRWLVERTFGWFNWCRRLSKDYEILPETTETFVYVAMIRLMLKQLA
nr:transposase [Nostoc flagelliforme]